MQAPIRNRNGTIMYRDLTNTLWFFCAFMGALIVFL